MEFQYKGLHAKLERVEVTQEELNRRMEQLRRQTPDITEITDRPSQLGDELVLDYAGSIDGVAFDGGTAQMQTLTPGSGMFIPGFEEQLLGKHPGEQVTVHVTFPEQYGHTALAGKAADFDCHIHAIRIHGEYAMDDRFAREVGHCENLQAMRDMVAASLRAYYDEKSERELQDNLIRQAAATLDFTPTEEELDTTAEMLMGNLKAQLYQRGLTLEQYCEFDKTTPEALLEDMRHDAAPMLRVDAAVTRIAALENIRATAEEIGEAFANVAQSNGLTQEQLLQAYDPELASAIEGSVIQAKVFQFVRDHAIVS